MGPRRPNAPVNTGRNKSHKDVARRPNAEHGTLPHDLQQAILDHFRRAFPFQDAANLKATIQEVKGHLFHRDFINAFGKPEYLSAYALRWSASRALCYADVFSRLDILAKKPPTIDDRHEQSVSKVVCIGGGGGAEIVALAAATHATDTRMEVTAVDVADWSPTLEKVREALITPPPLSTYASEALRQTNRSMVEPERLRLKVVQQDILECKDEGLREVLEGVGLCTIMFTLNEMFSSSISKTTALLLGLGEVMGLGTWLVVVDSPGSYSEVGLGKEQTKQYPMKWLLDHTLMKLAKGKWEKVMGDDSKWFRVADDLKYHLDLENMRYQIHLYRRIG